MVRLLINVVGERDRLQLLLDYLRGPVRDTAWVTLGALIGGVAAVAVLLTLACAAWAAENCFRTVKPRIRLAPALANILLLWNQNRNALHLV